MLGLWESHKPGNTARESRAKHRGLPEQRDRPGSEGGASRELASAGLGPIEWQLTPLHR